MINCDAQRVFRFLVKVITTLRQLYRKDGLYGWVYLLWADGNVIWASYHYILDVRHRGYCILLVSWVGSNRGLGVSFFGWVNVGGKEWKD